MNPLSYAVTLDNRPFLSAFAGVRGAMATVAGVGGSLAGAIGPLVGVAVGFAGVGAAAAGMSRAIREAADMESLQTSFTTLLGSVDLAKKRMADLAKFAETTPFELGEIANASRLLQAFTGDSLGAGQGLRLVGDAASAVGQPIQDVSMWMGRLFAALQDGTTLGEPIQNLTQLGLISGETRKALQALSGKAQGADGAMKVLAANFGKYAGSMERQSQTWNGLMSTLRDNISAVFREFGTPVVDSLKPILQEASGFFEKLKTQATALGQQFALAFGFLVDQFEQGNLSNVVGLALKIGFGDGINYLVGGFKAAVTVLTNSVSAMFNADFFAGLVVGFLGVSQKFGAALLEIFQEPIVRFQAGIQYAFENIPSVLGPALIRGVSPFFKALDDALGGTLSGKITEALNAAGLQDTKRSYQDVLTERRDDGAKMFGDGAKDMSIRGDNLLKVAGDQMAGTLERIGEIIGNTKIDPAEIVNTEAWKTELGALFGEFKTYQEALKGLQQSASESAAAAGAKAATGNGGIPLAQIRADNFARAGMFIGGSGPQLDYNRRTAKATEETAKGVKELSKNKTTALTAAWA